MRVNENGLKEGLVELSIQVIKGAVADLRNRDMHLKQLIQREKASKCNSSYDKAVVSEIKKEIKKTKRDIKLLEDFFRYSPFVSMVDADGKALIEMARKGRSYILEKEYIDPESLVVYQEIRSMEIPVRDRMKRQRSKWGLDFKDMGEVLGISHDLYEIIEKGGVTHPNIARRIQKLFELSEEDYEELIPVCRRTKGAEK